MTDPTHLDLLPGYESDEDESPDIPIPIIVVQSPTNSPSSPPATAIPSPPSAPIASPAPLTYILTSAHATNPPTVPTNPPLRRSPRLIQQASKPIQASPPHPFSTPRRPRVIQTHRRTARPDVSLMGMARMIERNLEASVELAEVFGLWVGRQDHRMRDVAKDVVEKKLDEVGGRYVRKRKAEEEEEEGKNEGEQAKTRKTEEVDGE